MTDRFFVMGQVYVADGTTTTDSVGRQVLDKTITITGGAGNFTIFMTEGITGTVTSGTAVITDSPVTLVPGLNTLVADGNGDCELDITIGTRAYWNTVNNWSAASGGTGGASVPTSADNTYFDANSFTGASQIVDTPGGSCKDFDWTGATNNPTFYLNISILFSYGNVTFIAAMSVTGGYPLAKYGDGKTLTSNGVDMSAYSGALYQLGGSTTLVDDYTSIGYLDFRAGVLDTAGQAVTFSGTFNLSQATAKTLTMGASVITCGRWNYSGSNLTVTANTATINITNTGTGALGGGTVDYNGADFNLNGTSHNVTGSFTCVILTRNGTATKTDSVTFEAGSTITCTTFAMIGNSVTNRLLVQSSILGTPVTITATNWTGADNADIMDITVTNAVDLSGVSSGDCGGNTDITFTTAAAQISNATGNWSTLATWQDGVGTDRVPLPQDDVSCSHNVTVDMLRIGKSITFTGTPTVSLSNSISNYGSWVMASGMTYTHNNNTNSFRGRSSHTLTFGTKSIYNLTMLALSGTYTMQDSGTVTNIFAHTNGLLVDGGFNLTLSSTGAITKWNSSGGTATLTGTIILINSGTNAQTFAGGGLTYNNVTIEGAGNYALTISGINTFNILTVDRSQAAKTINFTSGTEQTVADFVCAASGSTAVTLTGTSTAGWTITKSGGGVIELDYASISYSTGTPANTWFYGQNSSIDKLTGWSALLEPSSGLIGIIDRIASTNRIFGALLGLNAGVLERLLVILRKLLLTQGLLASSLTRGIVIARGISVAQALLATRFKSISRSISVTQGLLSNVFKYFSRSITILLGEGTSIARKILINRIFESASGLLSEITRKLEIYREELLHIGLVSKIGQIVYYIREKTSSSSLLSSIDRKFWLLRGKDIGLGLKSQRSKSFSRICPPAIIGLLGSRTKAFARIWPVLSIGLLISIRKGFARIWLTLSGLLSVRTKDIARAIKVSLGESVSRAFQIAYNRLKELALGLTPTKARIFHLAGYKVLRFSRAVYSLLFSRGS